MQVNKVLGIYTGCFSQVITYLKSSASSYHQNSLKLPPNLTLWEFLRTSYICLSVTMLLNMCLIVTLKFIYNTKIKKKKHPTTHRSNKVYVVKDLRCNFFPFSVPNVLLGGHWLICIHFSYIILLSKNSYSKFKSDVTS